MVVENNTDTIGNVAIGTFDAEVDLPANTGLISEGLTNYATIEEANIYLSGLINDSYPVGSDDLSVVAENDSHKL